MGQELTKISPEQFDVANAYLQYGSVEATAEQLMLPRHEIVKIIQTPEIKRYLDGVYLDMGYRNRDKLGKVLDKILDAKLEEAEESGIYTSKDILEIIALQHKMRMDEIKAAKETVPGTAVQINSNHFGGSDTPYGKLMERITNGKGD